MSADVHRTVPVRCVILGASNVTLGWPVIGHTLQQTLPPESEVFVAHGHGRSYLRWSAALHRRLPGILQSQLWADLSTRPPARETWALVADVGNDLVYGASPDTVLDGVRECYARLAAFSPRLTCVRPPLERIRSLTPRTYRLFKNLFFPGPTRPWPEMQDVVQRLDQQLIALATEHSASLVTPDPRWYAWDPIHIRRSHRLTAWTEILAQWPWPGVVSANSPGTRGHLQWWSLKPAERELARRMQRTPQPARISQTGVAFWLY